MTIADRRSEIYGGRRSVAASQRRPDLQGMRAIAVLTVFSNHLFDWPTGGFVGVDVFFVLSGFFITGILIRERTTRKRLSFQRFYVRRVKRILPSAMLVLVATVLGSYFLFPPIRARETLVDALYAAIFASNFRFQAVGTDYFQQDQPPSPLQHYWSLSIEEQFYFVWPLLLVLIFAGTRGLARKGHKWTRQWGLFCAMALIVAASFAWAAFLSANDPNSAYFSTFGRVWELGVGALVAIAGPWLTRIPSAIRPVLAYLGLLGVAWSLFLIDAAVQFPAPWAAMPVLSTALVVASFHGDRVRWMFPLTNPIARFFGDTSYTLYLWHWPVIILLMTILPKGPTFYIIAVVVALVLTILTYYYYENPIRKSDWLLGKPSAGERRTPSLSPRNWAIIGGALIAVVLISILGIRFNDKISVASQIDVGVVFELEAPPPAADPLAITSSTIVPIAVPLPGSDPCFGAPAMIDESCALWRPEEAIRPSLDKFTADAGAPTCWTNKDQQLESCTYGYVGNDARRIALVGDSHAARLLVAVAPYLTAMKWHLTSYIGWGCSWQEPAGDECEEAMADTQRELLAQPYDLVLTTSSRRWGDADRYVKAWAPVAAAGSRIAVLADNPAVTEESLACLTRPNFGGGGIGQCSTPRAEALAQRDPLIAASTRIPAATLIDLTPYYCTEDLCPSIIGNVIVYGDVGAHVTATYIRTLAPAIVDGVRRALES